MLGLFKKTKKKHSQPISVDVHSHLIPGVDDGVQSYNDSLDLLKKFRSAGYQKVITTPHIMQDFYDNEEDELRAIHEDLTRKASAHGLTIKIELAAEYYLDERLNERISDSKADFLTFGSSYLLFETSFMNQPFYLKEFIFNAKSRGLNPVLAHPERYMYLHNNITLLEELMERGVLLQLNTNSLLGYYSKQVKKFSQKLVDQNMISFVGSDCHNLLHFETLLKSRETSYYEKLLDLPLLNRTL